MGTMQFSKNNLIKDADMSKSFMSEPIPLNGKDGYSISSVFTGAPVGTMYIAVSDDNEEWFILPNSPQTITEAGRVFFNVREVGYEYAMLVYVATSGAGVCNSKYTTKDGK